MRIRPISIAGISKAVCVTPVLVFFVAVRTHITITLLAALLFAGVVVADGTHGTKGTVENNTGYEIEVQTFNAGGPGGYGEIPHKVYYISNNGKRTVKAHGKGTNRITLLIHKGGSSSKICFDVDGNKFLFQTVGDGFHVIIDSCHS